jgi:hypothetical protein
LLFYYQLASSCWTASVRRRRELQIFLVALQIVWWILSEIVSHVPDWNTTVIEASGPEYHPEFTSSNKFPRWIPSSSPSLGQSHFGVCVNRGEGQKRKAPQH